MKILVLGDTHGRSVWYDIILKENDVDKIIFLGDYVSTNNPYITPEVQISELTKILTYKDINKDKVILLRGNHDIQHLGYSWAECSGFIYDVFSYMSGSEVKERFLNLTQWIYVYNNIIFSHAGISKVWLENIGLEINSINNLIPSEIFGFWSTKMDDYYGTSPTQPCTWIRPSTLEDNLVEGYIQVVGHTSTFKCREYCSGLWLCDSLENNSYLVIEDGKFIPKIL